MGLKILPSPMRIGWTTLQDEGNLWRQKAFKRNAPDIMALGLSLTDGAIVQNVFERNAEQ